jgi:DNA-binding MarR family transcriptional regulator
VNDALLVDRLLAVTVLLQQDMTQSLGGLGLTTARTHLLWELHQLGPSTQQALAKALGVTPRNVTGLVDALESHGYVQRRPHPRDRRALLVTMTDVGERTITQMQADRLNLEDQLTEGFDKSRLKHLTDGLDAIIGRLQQLIDQPEPSAKTPS